MTIDKIAHDDEELLQVLDAYNYDRSQCASALRSDPGHLADALAKEGSTDSACAHAACRGSRPRIGTTTRRRLPEARCAILKPFPQTGQHAARVRSFFTTSAPRQVVAVLKTEGDRKGKVLRSIGYTEEIPAASDWELREDGSFYMKTFYTMTGAEETIWFATPDLRMRLSNILSKGGKGVTTSTLTTERRQKSNPPPPYCCPYPSPYRTHPLCS
jgi:hypothetical protein